MILLRKVLAWLVTFLIPFALTFLGLRLLLTHAFPEIEYNLPGFPEDEYGLSLEERMYWSKISIDYLLDRTDDAFLESLVFPDGSVLFNEREMGHMRDVKQVIQPVLWIGYTVWLFLAGLGIWAWVSGWRKEYANGIRRGGWLSVGLVAAIGLLAVIDFWQFFTVFHELFFQGDSWLFYYSDTLIRLFPLRFWQDAFLFAGGLDFLGGLALALGLRLKGRQGVIRVVI